MVSLASVTHYGTLGVSSTASAQEVRKNYLRLALLEHPDKGGSKERFQALVIAFEVLSSARLRCAYDEKLKHVNRSSGCDPAKFRSVQPLSHQFLVQSTS